MAELSKDDLQEIAGRYEDDASPRMAEVGAEGLEREQQCETHGSYTARAVVMSGNRLRWPGCPQCAEEAQAAIKAEATARALRERVARHRQSCNIPPRFQRCRFEGYQAQTSEQRRVLRVVRGFAERFDEALAAGNSMALLGSPGTGKTHLACAAAHELLEQGYSVELTTALRAVRRVRQAYSDRALREETVYEQLRQPDLLIIDEVGIQHGTEGERVVLFEILNQRYEHLRPTLVLANLSEPELGDYLGARVVDRLREGGVFLTLDWQSWRRGAA